MATATMGTAATTTLTALVVSAADAAADIATIQQAILDDQNIAHPVWPGAWSLNGLLYVPNRGFLKPLPGDYVAVDPATGWPILVSKLAAAGASWVHT